MSTHKEVLEEISMRLEKLTEVLMDISLGLMLKAESRNIPRRATQKKATPEEPQIAEPPPPVVVHRPRSRGLTNEDKLQDDRSRAIVALAKEMGEDCVIGPNGEVIVSHLVLNEYQKRRLGNKTKA